MTTAQPNSSTSNPPSHDARRPKSQQQHSIFSVPTPIKQLFDRFPLLAYPANDLPLRAPANRHAHVLHIFSTEQTAREGRPSFNPNCLKWQTYLKFRAIDFELQASNNHASPSGALPFLIPAVTTTSKGYAEGSEAGTGTKKEPQPVPSGKLQKWVTAHNSSGASTGDGKPIQEPDDVRYEAYLSLVDLRVRRAWLYTLYLSPNFASLAIPLYIDPTSAYPLVRLANARSLQQAALAELLKQSAVVNADDLHRQADEAFAALDMLLGEDEWFFGASQPGLFDASVFAYTHLLLEEELGEGGEWVDGRLRDAVRARKGLVAHRGRVLDRYFGR